MKASYLGYLMRARGVESESALFDKIVTSLPTQEAEEFLSAYFDTPSAAAAETAAHQLHVQHPVLRQEALQFLAAHTGDEVIVGSFDRPEEAAAFQTQFADKFANQAVVLSMRQAWYFNHVETAQGLNNPFVVVATYSPVDVTAEYVLATVAA